MLDYCLFHSLAKFQKLFIDKVNDVSIGKPQSKSKNEDLNLHLLETGYKTVFVLRRFL